MVLLLLLSLGILRRVSESKHRSYHAHGKGHRRHHVHVPEGRVHGYRTRRDGRVYRRRR
jgi:hypothetical protein